MADANTGETRLDLNDAVNSILIQEDSEATTSEDEVTQAQADTDESSEVSAEEAAVTESQADSTNVETEAEAEEEAEEEEAEESEEESEESDEVEDTEEVAETDEEPVEYEIPDDYTIMTDEDGNEVTLDEVKRGYLRQSDYTKKTQALAEERNQLGQVAEQVGAERQTLAEHLNLALNVVEPQLAEYARTDWDRLAADDAYEYAEKRALFDQAKARYEQISQAAQQVVQQQKAQQANQLKQKLAQEAKALQMAIPDMADPNKAKSIRQDIRDYAVNVIGLNENEASSIYDHRMIVMMDKARKFDQLESSSLSAAKKKVAKTPKKVIRQGKPTSKSEQRNDAVKQKQQRLKQTGSVDDAVDLILSGM